MAEVGGPEAVGGDEDEGADAGGASVLGEETGGVDVGGPEEMFVHAAVGKLGGDVMDGVEAMLSKDAVEEGGVAEVALNAGESGERVFIGLEVDVDDGMAFAEEAALEDTAEEAGGSGDEQVGH